jgi:hypothetical protein
MNSKDGGVEDHASILAAEAEEAVALASGDDNV